MKNKPLRGFKDLIGQTIKKIDASAGDLIRIETEYGEEFVIYRAGDINCKGLNCTKVKDSNDYWIKNFCKHKE